MVNVGGAKSLWLNLRVVTPGRSGSWTRVQARLRYDLEYYYDKKGVQKRRVKKPPEKAGDAIEVVVRAAQVDSARLEVVRVEPLAGVRRRPGKRPGKKAISKVELEDPERMLDELEVGEKLEGVVQRAVEKGVVVDCGVGRRGRKGKVYKAFGLLERKRFPEGWASEADGAIRDDVDRVLKAGDKVALWVRAAHADNGFLWLDGNPVNEKGLVLEKKAYWDRFRQMKKLVKPDELEIGEVREGVVVELAKFGAFVDIGVVTDGLVHFSCMGRKYRVGWEKSVIPGEKVCVMIRDVSGGKGYGRQKHRISLDLLALGEEDIAEYKEDVEGEKAVAGAVIVGEGAFARPAKNGERVVRAEETDEEEDSGEDDEEDDDGDEDDFDITDDYLDNKYGDF